MHIFPEKPLSGAEWHTVPAPHVLPSGSRQRVRPLRAAAPRRSRHRVSDGTTRASCGHSTCAVRADSRRGTARAGGATAGTPPRPTVCRSPAAAAHTGSARCPLPAAYADRYTLPHVHISSKRIVRSPASCAASRAGDPPVPRPVPDSCRQADTPGRQATAAYTATHRSP